MTELLKCAIQNSFTVTGYSRIRCNTVQYKPSQLCQEKEQDCTHQKPLVQRTLNLKESTFTENKSMRHPQQLQKREQQHFYLQWDVHYGYGWCIQELTSFVN